MKATVYTLFLIVLFGAKVSAQLGPRFGLGLESYSSGNSLGTFFRPYIGLEFERDFFSAGVAIQKQSGMIKGVKVGYSRNLSADPANLRKGINEPLQINFTSYLQYTDGLVLGKYALKEQYCISGNKEVVWKSVLLSTLEIAAGVEIRVNITRSFAWRNSAATSFHYHTQYVKGLSGARAAFTLGLCTGVILLLD